jgi:hypothetical protein
MRTSKYYVTTLDPLSTVDMEKLTMIRKTVSMLNSVTDTKQYVKLHGRGPRKQAAIELRRPLHCIQQTLPLSHAQRLDVYIYNR